MVYGAKPADMTLDRDVVWWVGEDGGGSLLAHQRLVGAILERIAAIESMRAQLPQVPRAAQRRAGSGFGYYVIFVGSLIHPLDQQIDLADLEPGHIEAEIEIEAGELAQLLAQKTIVPSRVFGELVVGDRESFDLRWCQVLEADRRNVGQPQLASRQQAAVPGHHS